MDIIQLGRMKKVVLDNRQCVLLTNGKISPLVEIIIKDSDEEPSLCYDDFYWFLYKKYTTSFFDRGDQLNLVIQGKPVIVINCVDRYPLALIYCLENFLNDYKPF